MVGIDSKNVSKIKNGNNYPTAETLTSIAKALNINIYELFVLKDKISYTEMREEIIKSLDDKKIYYVYTTR